MAWRTIFAGVSIYVLVSMMGDGIRPEDAVEWVDMFVRMLAALYLADWIMWLARK